MLVVNQFCGFGAGFRPVSHSYRDARIDANGLTTYDYAGVDFGAVSPFRTLLLAVGAVGTGARSISSFTIDQGGSKPLTPELLGSAPANISGNTQVMHLYRTVENNASASGAVRIVWDGAMNRCFLGVIAAYNLRGLTVASPVGQGGANIDPTLNINTRDGGLVFGASMGQGTATSTWSGLTKHFDDLAGSVTAFSLASAAITTGSQPTNISVAISGTNTYSAAIVASLW